MPTEQETAQIADLTPLLSAQQKPLEWINSLFDTLPALSLRSTAPTLLRWNSYIDALLWQLQQAELKKNVEFESAARRFTGKLPSIQAKIRDLKMAHRGMSPLQEIINELAEIEVRVDRLRELLDSEQIERLKELRRRKGMLQDLLRMGGLEMEWRKNADRMRRAIESNDLDSAQDSLEQLDKSYDENWANNAGKKLLLNNLRQELVTLIKNNL
ncbi:hypothetical protein PSACC_01232 [Paramicrosporidium saccamoebae]|uniref:Uncharacterized protein n=1 Tax=Paramicrosporidium saccamoebae TaxID=1246581 RepID=A0A2H9TMI2_9FUNG|nr:hypothetical protein PSACC_01232 [Paramicrosporidium saccamoebae]